MKFVVEKKTIKEFEPVEQVILDYDQSFDQQYESWTILDRFFAQDSYEKDFGWRWTYFRLYVRLTWKMIGIVIDDDKFVEIIKRQVPMAILLDIDVFREVLWYLSFSRTNKNRLASLYPKIRSGFLESQQVVGSWQGKSVTVKDVISEYVLLKKRGDSSMEVAEFITKLKQILFSTDVVPYIYAESDAAIDRFLEVVNFFQDIDVVQKLDEVLEVFMNPDLYEKKTGKQTLANNEVSIVQNNSVENTENKEMENNTLDNLVQETKEETSLTMSYSDIKSLVEQEFKKDSDGNFENIEGVMRRLEEFAEKYNDHKIADLLYFDEDENMFKWRV